MFAATCYNSPDKYAERIGKSCLSTGHTSGSRSRFVEMRISEVSRACIDQLIRAEQGVVKNVQSQRYVQGDFEYYTDPRIAQDEEINAYYTDCMETIRTLREGLSEALSSKHGS